MAQEWGKQNDTKVTVDVIPVEQIRDRAFAEVKAGKGHDIFIFPWPPAEFHQHVIDHGDIYQMVAAKYGAIQQLAFRSTFNPGTKKYFAFADFWMPSPLHFFQDYWAQIGMPLVRCIMAACMAAEKRFATSWASPAAWRSAQPWKATSLCTPSFTPFAPGSWMEVMCFLTRMCLRPWALEYIQALYRRCGNARAAYLGVRRQRAGHAGA